MPVTRTLLVLGLAALNGCTCPGVLPGVDPASGCCVPTSRFSTWQGCTFTCDAGECVADQPHSFSSGIGVALSFQTQDNKVRATFDLSCGP